MSDANSSSKLPSLDDVVAVTAEVCGVPVDDVLLPPLVGRSQGRLRVVAAAMVRIGWAAKRVQVVTGVRGRPHVSKMTPAQAQEVHAVVARLGGFTRAGGRQVDRVSALNAALRTGSPDLDAVVAEISDQTGASREMALADGRIAGSERPLTVAVLTLFGWTAREVAGALGLTVRVVRSTQSGQDVQRRAKKVVKALGFKPLQPTEIVVAAKPSVALPPMPKAPTVDGTAARVVEMHRAGFSLAMTASHAGISKRRAVALILGAMRSARPDEDIRPVKTGPVRLHQRAMPTWRPKVCQWPHGDPGSADYYTCGANIPAPGLPYCHAHMMRAYVPADDVAARNAGYRGRMTASALRRGADG